MQKPLFGTSQILLSHKIYCFFARCVFLISDLDKIQSEKWTYFFFILKSKALYSASKIRITRWYIHKYIYFQYIFIFYNFLVCPWLYPISPSYIQFSIHIRTFIHIQCDRWWLAFLCQMKSIYCRRLYIPRWLRRFNIYQSFIIKTYVVAVVYPPCVKGNVSIYFFCRRYKFFYFMIRIPSRWWWQKMSHMSINILYMILF